jgi:outer membrane murein-binding lipoprotein Lpp
MTKNIVAALVIGAILVAGGARLYRLDEGQANRTNPTVTAKAASD